jgi:hypothetical protein
VKAALLALLALAGCYSEPSGLPWTGDQTTATSCNLGNGISVTADGPVYCGAVAANWQMAHDAIVPKFTTEEEWGPMTANTTITIQADQRCLDTSAGGGARGNCTYEVVKWQGASFDWTPVSIESNEAGVQFTHEALHIVAAWNNDSQNATHGDWNSNGYYDVADAAAEKAYKITP